eukprot:scaffold66597_cov70-Phaeocystis_antarctica.AAC.1
MFCRLDAPVYFPTVTSAPACGPAVTLVTSVASLKHAALGIGFPAPVVTVLRMLLYFWPAHGLVSGLGTELKPSGEFRRESMAKEGRCNEGRFLMD